jgi:hypothetical protein
MHTKSWSRILMVRDQSEDLGIDRKLMLEWISGNRVVNCGVDSPGSG